MPENSSTDQESSETRFTLPRTARVLRRKDFRRIYGRGSRAGGKDLVLVALRRQAPGHRLGLSVSKANGCAVVRNKIKRIFREAFRLERPSLPGQFDVIMIPRERPEKFRLEHVRSELVKLMQRIDSGKGRSRGNPRPKKPKSGSNKSKPKPK